MQNKRDHSHIAIIHLFGNHLHSGVAFRVREVKHFVEDPHEGHHTVHAAIILAGQQVLCDVLENEEGLWGRKPVLNQEGDDRVHALAVPHVGVVLGEGSQHLLGFILHFWAFIGPENILLNCNLKRSWEFQFL